MRQNNHVPRYAKPLSSVQPQAEAAMKAFGMNQVRAAIVRHLALNPDGVTSGQITRELSATYQTIFRHLQDLEEQGIVTSDAGEHRHGQRVIYTLNKAARDKALADYAEYLDGK
jgi:DNA-binding transcriptional ArsR family regulator